MAMRTRIGCLLGVVIGFGGLQAATAADLPTKAPTYVAPVNWTGWYIGGNAGWVGSTNNTITNTGSDIGLAGFASAIAVGAIPSSVDLGHSGFIGGGQIGYNWQSGNWVFGLEADFSGANLKSDATVGPIAAGGFVPQTTTYSRELDWLATFRGRVGIIATPEFLLYGTGGLAVGHTKIGNAYICPSCVPPASSESTTANNASNTETGWTVGAGLEWMFAPHWSVKAEYLYVDLGSHDSTITYTFVGSTTTMTSSFRDRENIARAGINYHF
jgi:outer membrane immunogenic protein